MPRAAPILLVALALAATGVVGCGGDDDVPIDGAQAVGGAGGATGATGATGTTGASGGGDCEPGYDPCVPSYPPDVDCDQIDGPVEVTGSDPHGLDGYDNDGLGCEY